MDGLDVEAHPKFEAFGVAKKRVSVSANRMLKLHKQPNLLFKMMLIHEIFLLG